MWSRPMFGVQITRFSPFFVSRKIPKIICCASFHHILFLSGCVFLSLSYKKSDGSATLIIQSLILIYASGHRSRITIKKRRIRAILRSNPAPFGFLFRAYFSCPAFWHAGQTPSKIILCRVIRYPDSAAIVLSGVGSYENGASQTAPQPVQIR